MKKAFTLAEILITLGVIGVVSALTMPTLISNHRAHVLETRFKKMYSLILQSVMTVKVDTGIDDLKTYCGNKDNKDECTSFFTKILSPIGDKFHRTERVYNFTGDTLDYNTNNIFQRSTWKLKDGSYIKIEPEWNTLNFIIDTNGSQKPNRLGHDLFIFRLGTNDKITCPQPSGEIISDEQLEEYRNNNTNEQNSWMYERSGNPCSFSSKQKANGYGCGYYAIININPEDNSKSYWKSLP